MAAAKLAIRTAAKGSCRLPGLPELSNSIEDEIDQVIGGRQEKWGVAVNGNKAGRHHVLQRPAPGACAIEPSEEMLSPSPTGCRGTSTKNFPEGLLGADGTSAHNFPCSAHIVAACSKAEAFGKSSFFFRCSR